MDAQPQRDATEPLGPVAPAEPADQLEPDAARRPAHLASLMAEIARAMQAAAAQERDRIREAVVEDEGSQVQKVRARGSAESVALQQGATEDVRQIESWCEEQVRLARVEADRRIADRRGELEEAVRQHGTLIETEVQSVHGAVQGYRDMLDAFFARLAEQDDPSSIAALAGTLPDPPDLDAIRAAARSSAMQALEAQESALETDATAAGPAAEPAAGPVAVMDAAAAETPVPVMDPGATTRSSGGVASRVIRSFASRTPPPQALR